MGLSIKVCSRKRNTQSSIIEYIAPSILLFSTNKCESTRVWAKKVNYLVQHWIHRNSEKVSRGIEP